MPNKIYFVATGLTLGYELWVTDGTTAGTILVKDIYVGINGSNPQNLVSNGTLLYFTADNGINGRELWKSDGTSAGTFMAANINPDPVIFGNTIPTSSNPQNLTVIGNSVYFSAIKSDVGTGTYYGRELWAYNTSNPNHPLIAFVKDINPNNFSGSISDNFTGKFQVIGSNIFFPANDGVHGIELWRSNSTDAGTYMVNDLFPGIDDGLTDNPFLYTNSGASVLYFEATEGQKGRELWNFAYCPTVVNITTTVAASTQKQQASLALTSSSNIANTDFTQGNLAVTYTAGKTITLQPGFQVIAKQTVPSIRNTVFKANVAGCN